MREDDQTDRDQLEAVFRRAGIPPVVRNFPNFAPPVLAEGMCGIFCRRDGTVLIASWRDFGSGDLQSLQAACTSDDVLVFFYKPTDPLWSDTERRDHILTPSEEELVRHKGGCVRVPYDEVAEKAVIIVRHSPQGACFPFKGLIFGEKLYQKGSRGTIRSWLYGHRPL